MKQRNRKYFEKQRQFMSWKRNLATRQLPELDRSLFADLLVKKEAKISIGHIGSPIAYYPDRSHIDEMAMISMILPAPVIKYLDFQAKTIEVWNEMGVPPKYFASIDPAAPNNPANIFSTPTNEDPYPLPFMKPMLLSPYCKTQQESLDLLLPYFMGDTRDRHPVTMERLDDE